ncbi:MAG: prepilin-type N-terminal cleavage/methylation domain-containing protein [bacterium]|nr:prepilin-type N-terminal cleavage/methylation domain-containing protein [bacterium]
MKEKGFTLIELLAVIVILAIIALIAVPIIIDIIEDSKKEALKRSAENYLKAVELAIAKENLNGEFNPNSCTIESGITKCGDKTLNVTVDGELPESGTISLQNGIIVKTGETTLTYNEDTLTYDENNKLIITKEIEEPYDGHINLANICDVEDLNLNKTIDVGEKATCQVNDEKNYTFYVLSKEGSNVNLILDRNVYYNSDSDYGLADETNKGLVDWKSGGGTFWGPSDALAYLHNATKSWTNVPNINLNYIDEGMGHEGSYGYTGIETLSGVTKIKDKEGNYVSGFELTNLKTRLPYYNEVSEADGTNNYLFDYLNIWMTDQPSKPTNSIAGISGYWLLSSDSAYNNAICVNGGGEVKGIYPAIPLYGVRPVITLSLN